MSENEVRGPRMLVVTDAVKPPPMKIGKISNDLVLPRAVPVVTAAVVGLFALIGALLSLLLGGGTMIITGAAVFAFIGYLAANYSPMSGESLLKWAALTGRAKRKQMQIDGEVVIPYVGIAPILTPAAGKTHLAAGAADVNPVHYDERGALRDESLSHTPAFRPPDLRQMAAEHAQKKQQKQQEKPAKPPKVKKSRPRNMPS